MSASDLDAPYTLRSLQDVLPIPRNVVLQMIQHGFVSPARGPRNEYRFTFQDLVLLRTAHSLQRARIPPRKIMQSLAHLRSKLPADLPLTGLRISALGNRITVRERERQWEADSGQLLMDFDIVPDRDRVAIMEHEPANATGGPSVPSLLAHAGELEEAGDHAGAEAIYRDLLSMPETDHSQAFLNLGAMMCDMGRCDEAVALYDEAIRRYPDDALLHYNRAIALEDHGRPQEALDSYAACLRLDPTLADAHYNLARLNQQLGHAQQALQHLSAYRRLQR